MTNHNPNQFPAEELSTGELVNYEAGYAARRYSQAGERVRLTTQYEGSGERGVSHIGVMGSELPTPYEGPQDMTIVRTASGRHIGYAGGLAIDMDRYEFEELPKESSHTIVIGEEVTLPMFERAEIVEEVVSAVTARVAHSARAPEKEPNYGFTVLGAQFRTILGKHRDQLVVRTEYSQRKARDARALGARMTNLYPPAQDD